MVVRNLLSNIECQRIIDISEQLGYEDLSHIYPSSYRNNQRVMVEDQTFVDTLFSRLQPHLTEYAALSENDDKPVALNPRLRICKYNKGGVFQKHTDGNCVLRKQRLASHLTAMVYLNNVAAGCGGATRFYGTVASADHEVILAEVQPEAGLAVVFPHRLMHDGEPVEDVKHIMRSDVLFRMDDDPRDDNW